MVVLKKSVIVVTDKVPTVWLDIPVFVTVENDSSELVIVNIEPVGSG